MSRWPRVAIIGGSLGGLTAALVLRDLGCQVSVYERSARPLEDRGAGIGLHPMTTRYLDENESLDTARVALALPWLRFIDDSGATLYEERANYRFSSWNTIYRALLGNFGETDYRLDHEVVAFEQDEGGVTIHCAAGTSANVDLLVCADGVASTSRESLQPNARAQYAGYVAWRGMVPEWELPSDSWESLADAITYSLIPSGHILVYPIPGPDGSLAPGRRLVNMVWYQNYAQGDELDDLMTGCDGELRSVSVPPGRVRAEHVRWMKNYAREIMAPPIAKVVERIAQPFVQAIIDTEVEKMAFGRVCLMGDGAFAVRPHAAAGTAKACADAWTLHDALQNADGDVLSALRAWEGPQLELGKRLLERTRIIGNRSQFGDGWVPGDPSLRFGLYGPGE